MEASTTITTMEMDSKDHSRAEDSISMRSGRVKDTRRRSASTTTRERQQHMMSMLSSRSSWLKLKKSFLRDFLNLIRVCFNSKLRNCGNNINLVSYRMVRKRSSQGMISLNKSMGLDLYPSLFTWTNDHRISLSQTSSTWRVKSSFKIGKFQLWIQQKEKSRVLREPCLRIAEVHIIPVSDQMKKTLMPIKKSEVLRSSMKSKI